MGNIPLVQVYGQTLENNIQIAVDETFIIKFPACGFSGQDYTWYLDTLPDDVIVRLEMDSEIDGAKWFRLKAIKKGTSILRFTRWNETCFYHITIA